MSLMFSINFEVSLENETPGRFNQIRPITWGRGGIFVGDFNYPGINWTNLTTETGIGYSQYKFIETVRDCFYYQHIKEPTRGRGINTSSCIELVFFNEECMISDINLESPLGKSDHSVISFTFNSYISGYPK